MQVMHESTISCGNNEMNLTKHGEFYFADKDLFSCLYKTNNECFSFVQWNKYFHEVKDEMFHSTGLRLVEWTISSFTS